MIILIFNVVKGNVVLYIALFHSLRVVLYIALVHSLRVVGHFEFVDLEPWNDEFN